MRALQSSAQTHTKKDGGITAVVAGPWNKTFSLFARREMAAAKAEGRVVEGGDKIHGV